MARISPAAVAASSGAGTRAFAQPGGEARRSPTVNSTHRETGLGGDRGADRAPQSCGADPGALLWLRSYPQHSFHGGNTMPPKGSKKTTTKKTAAKKPVKKTTKKTTRAKKA
jgi:hypothetical protein